MGGAIGGHVCQLAKKARGASYVCGVSEDDPERLLRGPLRCDDAIDYTREKNIFEFQNYKAAEPFDTMIDLASGGWPILVAASKGGGPSIVKPVSQPWRSIPYYSTSDQPIVELNSFFGILSMFMPFQPMWRAFTSRVFTRNRLLTYDKVNGIPDEREVITRTLELAKQGTLQPVMDPNGPFPMKTEEGVRQAFRRQESRHAKGKVVITVAKLQS
jgi:NADPH:quinone reductase-like Zn-dependent oxidoreductase